MLKLIKLSVLFGVFAFVAYQAEAGQRYAISPPVMLSPDLASAWTLQIKPMRRVASVPRRMKHVQNAAHQLSPDLLPAAVRWSGGEKPGTLIVNTIERRLYLVTAPGKARRYAVGVGKPGFEWAGTHRVSRKVEWPDWRPPAEMIARERRKGRNLKPFYPGGIENPLGARALYLGSSIYRIHGTNQDWSVGKAISSGCIRMRNQDVMELYERVPVGARVKVI